MVCNSDNSVCDIIEVSNKFESDLFYSTKVTVAQKRSHKRQNKYVSAAEPDERYTNRDHRHVAFIT